MAVRRAGQLHLNPSPDFTFQAGDVAILLGDRPQIDRALVFLDPKLGRSSEGRVMS